MKKPPITVCNAIKEFAITQYKDYVAAVTSGKRIAGELEQKMVQRQLDDLKRTDWEWSFSWDEAVKPLIWIGYNLVFPKGAKRGKTMRLEAWQIFITCTLFGWVRKNDNVRRFIDSYTEVARKNGKTTWVGALGNYMAFSDEEGDKNGSTYIAATSLDQSGDCFESAQLEMELAGHEGMKFSCSKNFKQTKMGTRKMVAVTSNPKDGRVFHCLIVEEFHEHDSRDLVDSILKGRIADPECLCFYVTSAGKNLFSPCKQEHDYAERVVRGILNDKAAERYFVAIFAPDKKDIGNIKEPDVWQKANPNWGVSVIPETFEVDYLKAVEMGKSAVNTFMTKNLDIWVMDNSRWADMPKWFACKKPIDQNELVEKKRQCFGGLDLSTISDFTAYTKDFYFDGIHHFVNRYYIPETETDNLSRRLKVPLYDWINAGYIIPTPGAVIDYAVIADDICQDRDTYNLRFVAGDPYHLKLLNVFMPDWWGDVGFEFSQGWRSISPCIISFEHDYKVGKVVCDDPVADWMMDCAEAKYSNDLVKLVKPDRGKSASRIDGVVTMVMAHDTAEVQGQAAQITKVSQLFSFM